MPFLNREETSGVSPKSFENLLWRANLDFLFEDPSIGETEPFDDNLVLFLSSFLFDLGSVETSLVSEDIYSLSFKTYVFQDRILWDIFISREDYLVFSGDSSLTNSFDDYFSVDSTAKEDILVFCLWIRVGFL